MAMIDTYKRSHKSFMPHGTNRMFGVLTPRNNKMFLQKYPMHDGHYVVFGVQETIELITDAFDSFFRKPELANTIKILFQHMIDDNLDNDEVESLQSLGYLPLRIRALPDGELVPMNVPCVSVESTHPDFAWLEGYMENLILIMMTPLITNATASREFHRLSTLYAGGTCDNTDHVMFQNNDFSFRTRKSLEEAMRCGVGILTHTFGTDNSPAVLHALLNYGGDKCPVVGKSVYATEHSVTCLNISYRGKGDVEKGEREFIYDTLTNTHKTGIVSIVSDTIDYFRVVSEFLPSMKEEILARDGKLVVRPDSGDPLQILCGICTFRYDTIDEFKSAALRSHINSKDLNSTYSETAYVEKDKSIYEIKFITLQNKVITEVNKLEDSPKNLGTLEILWRNFGGSINDKGYMEINSKISVICGDGIDFNTQLEIFKRMEALGYASNNIVFGHGTRAYGLLCRDDLSIAFKSTYGEVNGESYNLLKNPKTDSSKKSQEGLIAVQRDSSGNLFALERILPDEYENINNELEIVYDEGIVKLKAQTLDDIRRRLGVM